jgi:hypothetical protein
MELPSCAKLGLAIFLSRTSASVHMIGNTHMYKNENSEQSEPTAKEPNVQTLLSNVSQILRKSRAHLTRQSLLRSLAMYLQIDGRT